MNDQRVNVMDLNLETADKHAKGMATEDSALRILASTCKSLKMEILQRVIPPKRSAVGECDAIVFSDSGILVVEVKRIGGNILSLNERDEWLQVEKGKETVRVKNPILITKKKVDLLKSYIHQDPEWEKLNNLFRIANIADGIPVYPVLCLGPSTNVEEMNLKDPDLLVATTRTLKKLLEKFLEQKPGVLGAYGHAKILAHRWRIQGVLRVPRKTGFVRVFPSKAYGRIVDFVNITAIEGRKTGSASMTYRDRGKKTSKDISSMVFLLMIENGSYKEVEVTAGTAFKWKAGG